MNDENSNAAPKSVSSKSNRVKYASEYSTWTAMINRCSNPKAINFKDYGGRGITVCERWKSFPHFLEDMGHKPKGASIERDRVNENYELGNCRWIPKGEQNSNKRNTIRFECNGRTLTLNEWSNLTGIGYFTLYMRLFKHGWTIEKALSSKAKDKNLNKKNARLIEFNGEVKCLSDWAKHLGMFQGTLEGRRQMGWSVERMLTEPIRPRSKS